MNVKKKSELKLLIDKALASSERRWVLESTRGVSDLVVDEPLATARREHDLAVARLLSYVDSL